MKVSGVNLTTTATGNFKQAVSVLVVCTIGEGDSAVVKGDLWQYNAPVADTTDVYSLKHTAGLTQLSGDKFTVTDKTCKVEVYVFFDGDNDYCTLEQLGIATTAATYSVDVQFSVA